jgi:hypothetical protein
MSTITQTSIFADSYPKTLPVEQKNVKDVFHIIPFNIFETFKLKSMKNTRTITLAALMAFTTTAFAQTVTVPANTSISMELTKEVREGKNRVGEAAAFHVLNDVVVDGVVVIPAKSVVNAKVTNSGKRELRVDLYDIKAVDGTTITLADCWIFTTAAQNFSGQGGKGAVLFVGTKKTCNTATRVEVKATGAKY